MKSSRFKQLFSSGFTVVELLVIIAVIGILVGLATVGYGAWGQRVATDAVKSDLIQASAAMEDHRNGNKGYPSSLPSTFHNSDNILVTYKSGNLLKYCIEGESIRYPAVHYYLKNGSTTPVAGTCPAVIATPNPSAQGISTTQIRVTWPAVAGATSYAVKYGTNNPTITASCSSSPCTISGLTPSTTYTATVTASNDEGSATSGPVFATTFDDSGNPPPSLPPGPTFASDGTGHYNSPTSLTLSWSTATPQGGACPAGSSMLYRWFVIRYDGVSYSGYTTSTNRTVTVPDPDAAISNYIKDTLVQVFCTNSGDINGKTTELGAMWSYPADACNTAYCRTQPSYPDFILHRSSS